MPSCDGFQCVKMIRDWEKKNNVPHTQICAVTADANPETRDRCLSDAVGFNEFLSKPLRKNVLKDMIATMCGEGRLDEARPSVKHQNSQNNIPPPPLQVSQTSKQKTPTEGSGGTHVLVVDDSPTMRLLLRQFLTGMGCIVSEATCGEAAIELVKSSLSNTNNPEPIELVFCDMRMPPGIGGLVTATTIKHLPGGSHLPIIGMTADDVSNSLLGEARDAGMVSLISKPIGKTQLTSFLAEYTGTLSVSPIYSQSHGSPDEEVFNKQEALEVCDNDKNFLKTLLADMSRDLKSKKQNLEISVQRKDCARVAEITHNIKGTLLG